ncbi:MAG: 1-acyl-sn-glycerol-3-phosphate acyltransferase [Planctomycetaceae bacterium]
MRAIADRVLRLAARAACLGWFRSVEVSGRDRVRWEGPLLVVANHTGGFVDAALLCDVLPRVPRFLAMARLWKVWPARPFLALAGAIPVQRAVDGSTTGNVGTFAAAEEALRGGGIVAIFPEGQASDEPRLLPVKTGAARIALGARARGVAGVRIVPVAIVYEAKQRARSRAYVRVGDPLDLEAAPRGLDGAGDEDHGAVRALTEEIRRRLADAAVDYDDAAQAADLWLAAEVSLRRAGGSPSWTPPLSALEERAGALVALPSDAQAEVRRAVADYRHALEVNATSDRAVAAGRRHGLSAARVAGGVLTVLMLPLALVGLVVNAVPALFVHLAGRRAAAPVTLATVKFLVALIAFPLAWFALRRWVVGGAAHPLLLTAALGPGCGLVAAVVGDRVRRARLARLRPGRLVVPDRAAEDLLERRAWLVETVAAALGEAAAGPGSPMHPRW